VIPTLTEPNSELMRMLKSANWVNQIIVTKEKPLNVARKNVLMEATTEFVAMFDDDVTVPDSWFSSVKNYMKSNVGAVASIARESDSVFSAYARVVSYFFPLSKISKSPHINNVLVRASLFNDYCPVPFFWGEDEFIMKHIISKGYSWRIIDSVGVVHETSKRSLVTAGVYYGRYNIGSNFVLLRRFFARLVFGSYLGLSMLRLMRHNVQFFAGFFKEKIKKRSDGR